MLLIVHSGQKVTASPMSIRLTQAKWTHADHECYSALKRQWNGGYDVAEC